MITVLLLLFLCVATKAANDNIYDVICNDSGEGVLNLEPVLDVDGRFVLKWCTKAIIGVDQWRLHMYYASVKPEQCRAEYIDASNDLHSYFEQKVNVDINCTNVCLTAVLDAIFGPECYYISTQQISHVRTLLRSEHYQYVKENPNFTIKNVKDSTAVAYYQNDGDDVVLEWQLGIPASVYRVYMVNNTSDDAGLVDMDCSALTARRVRCRARAAPGHYRAVFRYEAPWTSLKFDDIYKINYYFNHSKAAGGLPVHPQESSSQWWWAAGAAGVALLLALLVLLVLLVLRAARAGSMKENILRVWIDDIAKRWQREGGARSHERLVLLYARDCAHATRAARTLAQLLQRVTEADVVDLYAPETVASAAPAGGAWLRALLARAGTRVLLLQTPALALYCARLGPDKESSPTLEAPLLGSRVAWRAPHAADALLLLALRLLTDSAHNEPLPYKKYYVAMTAGLQHSDVVPALTPQRRYQLPHAAAALLADLSPDPAADPLLDPAARHLLQQYTEALEQFRQYALDHPNYLFEDLVFENKNYAGETAGAL